MLVYFKRNLRLFKKYEFIAFRIIENELYFVSYNFSVSIVSGLGLKP